MLQFCFRAILITTGLLLNHFFIASGDESKITPCLQTLLNKGERANVIVYFNGGVQTAINKALSGQYSDRALRNQAIIQELESQSKSSQAGVENLLQSLKSKGGFKYIKKYWTSNKIFVKAADADTIKAISGDPQVRKIDKERNGKILPIRDDKLRGQSFSNGGPSEEDRKHIWGCTRLQCKEAWEELGGNTGKGIVVATIDTGVRHTHEALRDNFIGIEYGWYDPFEKKPVPYDGHGHGTHVTGVIAAKYGLGVAPGAKWMTCVGCDAEGTCHAEALLDCFTFMACPTLPDGTNRNCSFRPHIVSNSWVAGEDGGNESYDDDISVWRALGIIPVAGIGNKGPKCNSTFPPANLPTVIGVGGVSKENMYVWAGSSIGWTLDGRVKPDLVAPVDGICCENHSDNHYRFLRGTSVSTPYVSGTVALLMVRNANLSYDEAFKLITETVDPGKVNPVVWEFDCNQSSYEVIPNIYFGYGIVNAYKAVKAQSLQLGISTTKK